MADKAAGKRKRPGLTAKERDFRRLKRGPSMPKVVPPAPVENVMEGLPNLSAIMPPPFPLMRTVGEGSSQQSKADRERIREAQLPEDEKVFEQASLEGFIKCSYAFADFLSDSPSNYVLFFLVFLFSNAF